MAVCPNCGSGQTESNASSGATYCTSCGTVIEENTIVSEITFGESSSGAAIVQGAFIGDGATGARISGPFRNQSSENSRDQTMRKGRQRINALANAMRLSERLAEKGVRFFQLAVNNGFIQGRRSQYVVASCLYITCRMEKTSHMLIDFSDVLNINVFVLGSTFLKFVKVLHLSIPLVDPSLYITRFAGMLEFGDDTQKVAHDATRLVARMKRDWLDCGRRPAGVCGAALAIAARMNDYRRTMAEIVYVVKVAEETVQSRLQEFSMTPSGELSVDDFRSVWLEREEMPPSFGPTKKTGKGKSKRQRAAGAQADVLPIDPTAPDPVTGDPSEIPNDAVSLEIAKEMEGVLQDSQTKELEGELAAKKRSEREASRLANPEGSNLSDVDDDEIDGVLLDEESIKIKTQVWMELNKDYLAAQEQKKLKADTDRKQGIRAPSKKKRRMKPRDSSAPNLPESPAESARQLVEERKLSKKINYEALDALFA
ncbi:Brf1-like TBP-binding domain-domain-containing protein [Protomyces lactucae-debilis]|uniref:B-related factor 1 n=1 Tax=Protomyces lactucae-debilis TaxID=2754530 RepID=A0A1Y2FKB8_PROLT|nr:Brf1-like TBP-binding domain-containing protein [Protomyces lactucae-debilis]ORY83666.1 Brf1-like TBP-binding domain-domain-containing protein [Protomyces lactucae-debilis]